MSDKPIRVLLVEDNLGDVRLIREALGSIDPMSIELLHTDSLAASLAQDNVDAVLLDLSLPDSQGLETLIKMHAQMPDAPIVVLTGLEDETLAIRAVHVGAQDYLIKGQTDGHLLRHALRYAIERQRLQIELRELSLQDDLTGLRNRRGFMTLAEHRLKIARRNLYRIFLLYIDVDGLKKINDRLGHKQGDAALIETAHLLQATFRESDITARLSGDEFAVLVGDMMDDNADKLEERLQTNLAANNQKANRSYQLSLSVGIAYYEPGSTESIDDLLERADALMYDEKRRKRNL